jgi:RNA polymerase sigma-70 factor (ECF subfamily)
MIFCWPRTWFRSSRGRFCWTGCHVEDPVAWVRRVAWNLATSRWRQIRRFNAFASRQRAEYAQEPSPNRVAVHAALATLAPSHRRVVIMYYLADMTVGQIAQQERVAVGTVKSWLYRARVSLAAQLDDGRERGHD